MSKRFCHPAWAPIALSMALWLPTTASAGIIINQDWSADWELTESRSNATSTGHGDGTGQGTLNFNQAMKQGDFNGSATASVDPTNFELKSHSDAVATVANSDDWGWTSLVAYVKSVVDVSDRLTVANFGADQVRVYVRVNGSFTPNHKLTGPPFGLAEVSASSSVRVNASLGGQAEGSSYQQVNTVNGMFDVYDVTTAQTESDLFMLTADLAPGGGVDFSLNYVDSIQYILQWLDADLLKLDTTNDFSHTLSVFADVYDTAGNWMPGVQVSSESGFNYRNYRTDATNLVSAPSSLALAGLGLVLLGRRSRRRVS